MTMRLRGTEGECRQATGRTGGNHRIGPSPGHENRLGSCGRDLGWRPATSADPARGNHAGPAAESVRRRTHEPERSPLTDKETEP
jgi:hypothetical protein